MHRDDHPRHGPTRVMASAPSVVQQARLMDAAGTAWHAVKCGNLEMITKLFPNQCNVYSKGPVGENVMHVAMLLNTPSTLAITRYLVKLYGTQLVNCPIQERRQAHDPPGTYEGQTALHIAIVNRDFDMVKFLVQHGANIRARAWGTFFRQDGPMYYGEYPLSFAACTGQKDVVAYLKRHGAQVNTDCDVFGNTALHLCVIHDQPDMYDFLVEYCAASDAVRNHQGLTPLVLAAQLGKMDMLQHIYSRRRRAFYSFGRVTSYSLALREIDTVQDEDEASEPDGGYVPNALEAVLRKRHLDMLQEPLLTTLLQHKWEAFARAQFLIHFCGYLLLEISQTLLIWLHSDPVQWNGPARASQEFLGFFLALCMLAVEVLDYANWSRECYHRRLTMTVHKEQDPPLYPIPGEMLNVRDNRQGLFARLSARMGFAGTGGGSTTSSTGPSSGMLPGGLTGSSIRSDGGFGTPRVPSPLHQAAVTSPAAGGSARAFGSGSSGYVSGDGRGTPRGAAGAVASPRVPQNQRLSFTELPEQPQQPRRQGSPIGSKSTPLSSSSAFAAAAAAAADSGGTRSPHRQQGQVKAPVSPTRTDQQIHGKSHDDPIDLRPSMGATIGEGRSPLGIAVVDSGYTGGAVACPGPSPLGRPPLVHEGSGAPAAAAVPAADSSPFGSISSISKGGGMKLPPGPLGEAREDEPRQQQQQGAGAAAADAEGAAAVAQFSRQTRSSTNDSSRHDDEDDVGFDVVSVGVRSTRMRSARAESGSNTALAASGSVPVLGGSSSTADGSSGAAAGAAAATGGSRSVSFSDASILMMRRSGSGRSLAAAAGAAAASSSSPRYAAAATTQQHAAAAAGATSAFTQAALGTSPLATESSGLSAAAAADMPPPAEAADGSTLSFANSIGPEISLQQAGTGSRSLETWSTPVGDSARAAGAGSGNTSGIEGGIGSDPSFRANVPRARSFHGITAGLSGISGLGSSGDGSSGLGRAATAGGDVMQSLMTTSNTPADPIEQVQMLERQRTRIRSGGGDLPAAHALKRTPVAKKEPASTWSSSAATLVDGGSGVAAEVGAGDGGVGGSVGSKNGALAGGESGAMKGDVETGASHNVLDPHKSRLRAMLETTYEGTVRMVEDPWLFVWHLHLLLTLIHFIIWISSYGWVGGEGPLHLSVRELDDVIVSMMGVSGWLAVIYFFRGLAATGKLAVVLERCIVDVVKFVSLYILWNLGFSLAFYTMQNGVLLVAPDKVLRNTEGLIDLSTTEPDPFSSIGYTMITLINLGMGLSHYEYSMTCKNGYVLSAVLCTMYYLLYMATVVLLLLNLLIAMIINTWKNSQGVAEAYWRHRWAIYVVKAERRLPGAWVQRLRLGQLAWDPNTLKPVYSHVFETVDDDKAAEASKSSVEGQIRAIEGLLEDLKKRRGSSTA